MELGLHGKRALVLGVSGGLGGAIARSLMAEGVQVAGASRKPPADMDAVTWMPVDAADRGSVDALCEKLLPEGVDIADFCGRFGGLYEALQHEMTPRTWDAALVSQVAASRRDALALNGIPGRQAWRDRRLMALAAHQAPATREMKATKERSA